jgi:hypothetical protein
MDVDIFSVTDPRVPQSEIEDISNFVEEMIFCGHRTALTFLQVVGHTMLEVSEIPAPS